MFAGRMHRVVAPGVHRVASENTGHRSKESEVEGEGLEALQSIFGTGGMEATPGIRAEDQLFERRK